MWANDYAELLKNNFDSSFDIEDFSIHFNFDDFYELGIINIINDNITSESEVREFLKNTTLQNKIVEAIRDKINEMNEQLVKLHSVNRIPQAPIMYQRATFFIGVTINSDFDSNISWLPIQYYDDIKIDWDMYSL